MKPSLLSATTTLIELVGLAFISYGFWMAWPPLGPIVGGVLLALAGYLMDRSDTQ